MKLDVYAGRGASFARPVAENGRRCKAGPLLAYDSPGGLLSVDESGMSAGFVISTPSRDRSGDVVMPEGCLDSLEEYARTGGVFFCHDTKKAPVALCIDPSGRLDVTVESDRVLSRAYFHCKTRESEELFGLVAAGVLRGASIGFVPVEAYRIDGADNREGDPRVDFDGGGFVFTKWRLTEWSVVPVPCNAEAVRHQVDHVLKSPSLVKWLAPHAARCRGLVAVSKAIASDPGTPGVPVYVDPRVREGDQAQSYLFSRALYHSPEDAKAWLDANGVPHESVSETETPNPDGQPPTEWLLAECFEESACEAGSTRLERVEDGVFALFCRVTQASEKTMPANDVVEKGGVGDPVADAAENGKKENKAFQPLQVGPATTNIVPPADAGSPARAPVSANDAPPNDDVEAPSDPGGPNDAPPNTKSLPYGAAALKELHAHAGAMKGICLAHSIKVEHPGAKTVVDEVHKAADALEGVIHVAGMTHYPDHFAKDIQNGKDSDGRTVTPGVASHNEGAAPTDEAARNDEKPGYRNNNTPYNEHGPGSGDYYSSSDHVRDPEADTDNGSKKSLPPGAQAIKALHSHATAMSALLDGHHEAVEHPGAKASLAKARGDVSLLVEHFAKAGAEHYPEHFEKANVPVDSSSPEGSSYRNYGDRIPITSQENGNFRYTSDSRSEADRIEASDHAGIAEDEAGPDAAPTNPPGGTRALPAGAACLKSMHGHMTAMKGICASHSPKVEHPAVVKLIARALKSSHKMTAHCEKVGGEVYPEHFQKGDESPWARQRLDDMDDNDHSGDEQPPDHFVAPSGEGRVSDRAPVSGRYSGQTDPDKGKVRASPDLAKAESSPEEAAWRVGRVDNTQATGAQLDASNFGGDPSSERQRATYGSETTHARDDEANDAEASAAWNAKSLPAGAACVKEMHSHLVAMKALCALHDAVVEHPRVKRSAARMAKHSAKMADHCHGVAKKHYPELAKAMEGDAGFRNEDGRNPYAVDASSVRAPEAITAVTSNSFPYEERTSERSPRPDKGSPENVVVTKIDALQAQVNELLSRVVKPEAFDKALEEKRLRDEEARRGLDALLERKWLEVKDLLYTTLGVEV